MPRLVINIPRSKEGAAGFASFDVLVRQGSGIAPGYAIGKARLAHAKASTEIVVLSKDQKRSALGTVLRINDTGKKTGSGISRYDIHVTTLRECAYEPFPVNRHGVGYLS